MRYDVIAIPEFRRQLKRLAKKYRSLKTEIAVLFEELAETPTLGFPIGNGVYKIRMSIASKGKGKSGGARVITYVQIVDTTVLLLSIYSKSKKDNVTDKEIQDLLDKYVK